MDDAVAKRSANVTHTQLETLVSFMEKYPSLATAKNETLSVEQRQALWFELYIQLNAVIEGTQKTLDQWKKVWDNQKEKTHSKAMMLIETGGNCPYLTPVEERILKISSLNKEFKSPEPSSDIFLIPDTGIVFLLPIVAQDQSQSSVSQDLSSTPSTSQDVPEAPLASQEVREPVFSDLSNISIAEDLHTKQEKGKVVENTLKSVAEFPAESTKFEAAESSKSVNNPPANKTRFAKPSFSMESARHGADFPSSTTTSKVTFGKGRKRRRSHLRSHYMTADKAAETFGYISERNCVVLERIASAMEAQASRAVKQTQLMREIVEIVKQK